MIRLPKDTQMTTDLLSKLINLHKTEVNSRFNALQAAYENKYKIYDGERADDGKPDNRVGTNFAKYITDTFNGFFCGIPPKVTSEDSKIGEFIEFLHRYNSIDNHNIELAKGSDILGACNEMYYVDEQSKLCIAKVSLLESFMVYDDSILAKPLFFIRYYKDCENTEYGSWSDKKVVQHFVMDPMYKWIDDEKEHNFPDVPATEFIGNIERKGVFESQLPLIDEYNKALSEKSNEVDYFNESYMKIIGPKVQEDQIRVMSRTRVINYVTEDGKEKPVVEFMQKPSADATQENLLDRLKDDIFQTSMVANINDINFGNASGVAIKYRLKTMSDLAKVKEGKFRECFDRRYRILFGHPICDLADDDWVKLNYYFTQNYPTNIGDEADTAAKLSGIVSEATQLKTLSIVDDVDKELERKKAEDAEKTQDVVTRLMFEEGGIDAEQS